MNVKQISRLIIMYFKRAKPRAGCLVNNTNQFPFPCKKNPFTKNILASPVAAKTS